MATFTHVWTYPTGSAARVQDGVVYGWGYQDTINGLPNPESKTSFIHRKLNEIFIALIKSYEAQRDAEIARAAALTSVDSIGITGS